jgi:hypothetical protein
MIVHEHNYKENVSIIKNKYSFSLENIFQNTISFISIFNFVNK